MKFLFLLGFSLILNAAAAEVELTKPLYCVGKNFVVTYNIGSIVDRYEDDNCFYSEKVARYVLKEILEKNIEEVKGF